MSQKFLNRLSESFPKVNINWLLKGQGEPLSDDDLGKTYQLEEGSPRTLEEMEAEYSDDPFRGLRDMYGRLAELEKRVAELEGKLADMGV